MRAIIFLLLALSCTQYDERPTVINNTEPCYYQTYPAEPFRRVHFGEMDNVFIDTLQVLSLTVKAGIITVRCVDYDYPIEIRPPDRLEALNGRH